VFEIHLRLYKRLYESGVNDILTDESWTGSRRSTFDVRYVAQPRGWGNGPNSRHAPGL